MRGWFDAFRHDGGPTLYDASNRTAVIWDSSVLIICIVVLTVFSAFVVIFPGVRKERFTTFTSVSLSLFSGAVILLGLCGSSWHVAESGITSSYRSFSSERVVAQMIVSIGLDHVNITLKSHENATDHENINFNERFHWKKADQLANEYHHALHKGLPFPILTATEYLSLDEEGFNWGRCYRQAGYYAGIVLWSAFASWCLVNILLVVVPRYGAYGMVFTGLQMLVTNLVYYILLPKYDLVIHIEESVLKFHLGWCFWLNFAAGILCFCIGFVIAVLDLMYPHTFSTILEVNYDTPYDRHMIIEESHDIRTKKNRPRLEEGEGTGFGSRMLKRLSRRGNAAELYAFDNPAMTSEGAEPPKSPWNLAHRQMAMQNQFSSGRSLKSTKSVNFSQASLKEHPKLEAQNSNTIIWKPSPPPKPELDVIEAQLVKQEAHTQTVTRGVSPLREGNEHLFQLRRSNSKLSGDLSLKVSGEISSSASSDDDGNSDITKTSSGIVIRVGGDDEYRRMKRQGSDMSSASERSGSSLGFSVFNAISPGDEEIQLETVSARVGSWRGKSRKRSGEKTSINAEIGGSMSAAVSAVSSKVAAFVDAIGGRKLSREEQTEDEDGPW